MSVDQNGMPFERFEGWLRYCGCHDVQWHQTLDYYVFENSDNNQWAYVPIVEYIDIIAIYQICKGLGIETPPHFINLEQRIRKILDNL
jgi:hypothetical protein